MSRLLLPLALLPLAAAAALAQGGAAVRGRLTIAERAGEPTRDVAEAVVWLVPAGTPGSPPRRAESGRGAPPAEILMQGRQFTPRVRVVGLGTAVEFPNGDPFRHNAFSNSALGPFDLGLYGKGERKGVTPARAGVYTVYCDIHARMRAHLVVVPNALWTQPGLDGRWTIAAVPPGRYVLRAWHERGGEATREVVVTAGGTAGVDDASVTAVALDARGYAVQPHKNKFGRDYPTRTGDRY
jgi:plastocyanin